MIFASLFFFFWGYSIFPMSMAWEEDPALKALVKVVEEGIRKVWERTTKAPLKAKFSRRQGQSKGDPPGRSGTFLLPGGRHLDEALCEAGLILKGQRVDTFAGTGFPCGNGKAYDPSERMILLPPGKAGFHDRVALVHGMVHAFQDQFHDLEAMRKGVSGNHDRLLALMALVEGEAQLVLSRYVSSHAEEMAALAVEEGLSLSTLSPLDRRLVKKDAPQYVIDVVGFSARAGERLVREVFLRESWEGVDRLFEAPPRSTEQVLHPRKAITGEDPPRKVELGDLGGALEPDWKRIFENTFGELGLSCLVRETLDAIFALRVGSGWGGDRYGFYKNKITGGTGFYLATVWDTEKDAWQFLDAMEDGMAFQLGAPKSSLSGKQDRIPVEGKKGGALVERRGLKVLVLKGFSMKPQELEELSGFAWNFTVE